MAICEDDLRCQIDQLAKTTGEVTNFDLVQLAEAIRKVRSYRTIIACGGKPERVGLE